MPTKELNRRRNVDDWVQEPESEAAPVLRNTRKYLGQSVSAIEENAEALRRAQAHAERYRGLSVHYFPDPYARELLETARTKIDREYFEKVVDAVAAQLNISRSQLRTMALAEFIERHGEGLKEHVGASSMDNPYWQISEYTDEEIDAIREADKLDPDLAKYYKDLLED